MEANACPIINANRIDNPIGDEFWMLHHHYPHHVDKLKASQTILVY